MKTAFRTFAFFALVLLLLAVPSFAAAPVVIEASRAHAAAGNFGCTVSGATVATPSVITCSAAHGLIDGDQIQVTGVGGTTTVNTTGYAKITGYSTTTFGLYSDAALSSGVTGTGSYTSGGKVSIAQDISGLSNDFSVRLIITALTAAKNAVVCIQDSADGYASDIVTLACVNPSGFTGTSTPLHFVWRKYQLPSLRLGVTNGRLRVNVQAIDGSASVSTSLSIEQ